MLSLKWPKEHHFVWLLESARKSASKHKIDSCRVDKIATNAYLEFMRWGVDIRKFHAKEKSYCCSIAYSYSYSLVRSWDILKIASTTIDRIDHGRSWQQELVLQGTESNENFRKTYKMTTHILADSSRCRQSKTSKDSLAACHSFKDCTSIMI